MDTAKNLIKTSITEQEDMLTVDLGDAERHSVNYCILVLKDILNTLEHSYEGEDGKLHEKTW